MNITQTASTQTASTQTNHRKPLKGNFMQLQTINTNVQTMSSREIAMLTDKEHKNVKRDIEVMLQQLNKDTLSFERTYFDSQNRKQTEFVLDQELTLTLVSGYKVDLRNKIIKRWQELEAQQHKNSIVMPNFTDPAEAAIAWATEYKAKQLALQQLEVAKPKVEFVDKFVERGTNRNVTSVAKELGVTAIKLGKWLRAKGYMNKATDKQVWNKEFIDKGYGVQKLFNVEVQDEEFKSGSQALITPAGDVFIKETIAKYGFTVEV